MRTLSLLLPLALLALLLAHGCASDTTQGATTSRAAPIRARYLADIDRLDSALALLEREIRGGTDSPAWGIRARSPFLAARLAYKRIEFLVEQYAPTTARGINGAALEKVEEGDPNQRIIPPEGLQVIETALYAEPAPSREATAREVTILRANVRRLRTLASAMGMSDANIVDAMRRQIIRVTALGLAGFDASATGSAVPEAAVSIESIRDAVELAYAPELKRKSPALYRELDSLLRGAIGNLQSNPDFLAFDRLRFIRIYANPLSARLLDARMALGIPAPEGRQAIDPAAPTMFAAGAIDPAFFAPEYAGGGGEERVELGRLLFFDPVLSGNGRRACASCHQPERAFTDGQATSRAFDARGRVARNAPTLLNASLQRGQFYDRHVAYLEDQVRDVLTNTSEMHGSLADAVRALRGSDEYVRRFAAAFGGGEQGITERSVRVALASYIRSLRSFNSPFDRYVRGESAELAAPAQRGFTIFMGKGKCGACHFIPLFNGTRPPEFDETESEIIGVPARFDTLNARLDPDVGRFAVEGIEIERFAFKTPTLRNIALTAPYMHNGAFRTLEEVIEFYDRGGGRGLGIVMERQTLPADRLNLTAGEKSDLIAFLKSLTDTAGTTRRPVSLPALPRYAGRRVGGEY